MIGHNLEFGYRRNRNQEMGMKLVDALNSARSEFASWRQHLHQNPEVAYEENDTSNFVAAKLESFGVEVHRGFGGALD